MTFLEMAQRLRQEAGIAGTGPSTVLAQTGEAGRVVDWILEANDDIQNIRATWKFLQESFSKSTVDGTQNYTLSDLSLTDLGSWKLGEDTDMTIYSSAADETFLLYVPWDEFRALYLFGANRSSSGRPTVVTVKPDNSISFWPIPDAVYTFTGEYFKKAQTMTADDDESLIPSQFHMIVVWRGLMFYGAYSGAADAYTHGNNEYKSLLKKLEKSQLPKIGWGEPLA